MTTIDQANMTRRLYHWLIASGYTPETPLNAIQITPELVSGRGEMVALELLRLAGQYGLPVPDAVWTALLPKYRVTPRGQRGRPTGTTSTAAADRRERIRAMAADGKSPLEIARELGCGKSTVYAALQSRQGE